MIIRHKTFEDFKKAVPANVVSDCGWVVLNPRSITFKAQWWSRTRAGNYTELNEHQHTFKITQAWSEKILNELEYKQKKKITEEVKKNLLKTLGLI